MVVTPFGYPLERVKRPKQSHEIASASPRNDKHSYPNSSSFIPLILEWHITSVSIFSPILKRPIFDFKTDGKNDAFEKISDAFFEKNVIKNKEMFYKNLLVRESIGTTRLEGGIAIPYLPSNTDRNIVVSILIYRDGIDFESLDGKPTYIFMVLTGKYKIRREEITIEIER